MGHTQHPMHPFATRLLLRLEAARTLVICCKLPSIVLVVSARLLSLLVVLAEVLLPILWIASVALLLPISVLLLVVTVVLLELLSRLKCTCTRLERAGTRPKCVRLIVYVEVLRLPLKVALFLGGRIIFPRI